MLHSYHCHPRISAGMHGPMVGNQRLHVRQGEVDATCGYHCVLMALMVLGQVRRNALIWDTRDVRLQALRKVAQRYYFGAAAATGPLCRAGALQGIALARS